MFVGYNVHMVDLCALRNMVAEATSFLIRDFWVPIYEHKYVRLGVREISLLCAKNSGRKSQKYRRQARTQKLSKHFLDFCK